MVTCLACMRPWVQSPIPPQRKRRKGGKQEGKEGERKRRESDSQGERTQRYGNAVCWWRDGNGLVKGWREASKLGQRHGLEGSLWEKMGGTGPRGS